MYVWWEPRHLDSDLCHKRAQSDAAHECRSSSFFTAAVEQRLALHGGCDCHHSVLLFYVAVGDGGVWRWGIRLWRCQPPFPSPAAVIWKHKNLKFQEAQTRIQERNSRSTCLIKRDTGDYSLATLEIWACDRCTRCSACCVVVQRFLGNALPVLSCVASWRSHLPNTHSDFTLLIKLPMENTLTQNAWSQSFILPIP